MKREEIVQAVQSATAEVFSTMLGIELGIGNTHIDCSSPAVDEGVMAFVGIAGPWVGSGVISCSATFACRLCELFLMSEATSVNEEVLDAVGEIANMVIGNFKTAAEAVVGGLGLSVPTVIYGKKFTSKSVGTTEWIVMPFSFGEEVFEVRLWFAPAAEPISSRSASNVLQTV